MKLISFIAVILYGCSTPETPMQRIVHSAQAKFNVPERADNSWLFGKCEVKHCAPFVQYLRPQLVAIGATNIRELEMTVAGQSLHHVALRFHAEGRDWICDNRRLAHAFGRTPQEEVEYFVNPFHEATANVILISP